MSKKLHVRATSDNRQAMARFLGSALTNGQLDPDEYAERVAAASEVKYVDEFLPLFEGLFAPDTSRKAKLATAKIEIAGTSAATLPVALTSRPLAPSSRRGIKVSTRYGLSGCFLAILAICSLSISVSTDNPVWFWALLLIGPAIFLCHRADTLVRQGR